MSIEITANCDCGAIKFKSSQNPIVEICCHCADCRDATKDDFSNIAFFKSKSVIVSGDVKTHDYISESNNNTARESCANCGDIMFDKSAGFNELIGVFAQRINKPFLMKTNCHVWVKSKLPHIEIPSGIPKHMKGIT